MKRAALFVLLLFTLSGVSGLIYEIVWIRQLSHLLGGTSYAIATVLAAFMGGLALGSRFYGPRADRCERPLLLYAKLEFGIAGLGALAYLLMLATPPAYAAVADALPGPVLALLRVLIAATLLLPPTFLMGGTLPVLSRFVVTDRERLGRGLGLLYAVNTLGATLGSFLAGFALVATLGLDGCIILAAGLNVLIGAAVWTTFRGQTPLPLAEAEPALSAPAQARPEPLKSPRKRAKRKADAKEPPSAELPYVLLAAIFALSGFASLGYELYWTRALQHFLGNSTYAFSAMLSTFLLGLAAGGWLGGRLADRAASPARALAWVQTAVGVAALLTLLLIWEWLPRVESSIWISKRELSWNAYLARRFAVAFLVMAPVTFLTGMTFPLVNRIGIASLARLGRGVGGLYFANTLGAILGSLAAGFLLLPLFGAKGALLATALLSVLLGLTVHLGRARRGALEPWLAAAIFVLLLAAAPKLAGSGRALLADTQEAGDAVLFAAEDHAAETRVYRKRSGDLHMSVDGHHIGGTKEAIARKEKIIAHLPMLLRPDAKSCLSIGLGSGITLGTLALYEELEILVCVEIVPGVVEGARFFAQANGGVLRDPRLDLRVGDGVQYLLTTRERFDIISSDSKLNPEYVGNAPLLSSDYYELCRDRLGPGGVMLQWLACHLPHEDLRVIARSFARTFPHVGVYWYDPYNIILAGSNEPLLFDMDAARAFAARDGLAADLSPLQLADPYTLAALWICGREALLANLGPGPVSSWRQPRIEFSMGRNFRSKSTASHEDDNLRWLHVLRDEDSQRLSGTVDEVAYRRNLRSAEKLLAGFSQGGGTQRLESGIELFEEALAANPGDPRASAVLAGWRRGDESLEKAYSAGALDSPEELARMGLLRQDQGRHEEALQLFEQAFAQRSDDPAIQYNRLLSLRALGRHDDFSRDLRDFIEQFPQDARGYTLRGRMLGEAGQPRAALGAFEKAAEFNPSNPTCQNNRATALAQLGRFEEAARVFEQVCELQPSFPHAAYRAAATFSLAGMQDDAARWAKRCIEQGLATPRQFASDPSFAGLRASEQWDARRNAPR